jgi:small subunit ribosomal protein S6
LEASPTKTLEYELILMLDPETPDENREQIVATARQRIESAGEIKQERTWGLRKMAYEIDKRDEADYRFFRFDGETALLDDLNHSLRITDGVLRYRIFKVDARMPVIDPPAPFSLEATAQRSGGRGGPRGRDGDRGGRYEDRGSREGSAPAASTPAPEAPAEQPTAAPAEAPAEQAAAPPAETPAEQSPAPAAEPEAPAAAPEGTAPAPEQPPVAEPDAPAADESA